MLFMEPSYVHHKKHDQNQTDEHCVALWLLAIYSNWPILNINT
jgi:hypothetical protein